MKDYIEIERETLGRLTKCSVAAHALFMRLIFDAVDNISYPLQGETIKRGAVRFIWGDMVKRTGAAPKKLTTAISELRDKGLVEYSIITAPSQLVKISNFESVVKY